MVDDDDHPVTVLPGYVQDDPSPARVFDERSAAEELGARAVRGLLPPRAGATSCSRLLDAVLPGEPARVHAAPRVAPRGNVPPV